MKNNHLPYKILTILFLFIITVSAHSQPVTWYRTWGLYNRGEQGKRVVQTFDGGYVSLIQAGYGGGNSFYYLLKYDMVGNYQWSKIIIDTTSRVLQDMNQTQDSGFICAGHSFGALLIKLDKNGNFQWQRNYTNLNPITEFNGVIQTIDNGFIACGSFTDYINPSEKGIVIKTDSFGNIQWERQYMDSTFNIYGNIYQDKNGKYYVAGVTSGGYPDVDHALVKKLDSLGNVIWNTIFFNNGSAHDIIQLKDGKLIIGGTYSEFSYYQPILSKIDTSGNIKWTKSYSTPLMWNYFMCKDIFGNIIITGNQDLLGTITNWKLDTSGNIMIIKNFLFSGYNSIYSNCIKPTNDTGFILTGNAYNSSLQTGDALIIKTDSAFNTPNITGLVNNYYLIPDEFKVYQNYPNPFNAKTVLKFNLPNNGYVNISIYNIQGKNVLTKKEYFRSGLNENYIDFDQFYLSSGVYFIKINFKSNSKLIKAIYLK